MTARIIQELGLRIPGRWSVTTFESLAAPEDSSFVGGPFGSDLTTSDYVPTGGVPVIRGNNLGGKESRFVDDDFVYVSPEKRDSLCRNLARRGDLIFTQRGTMGQVALIPANSRYAEYVISQSQMKLTVDPSKADAQYLYYFYRSPAAVSYLFSRVLATGVPHINLGILKRFPVVLPPLAEQKQIAVILNKADAICRRRQEAARLADEFLMSGFLHIVGPFAKDYRRWPRRTMESLASTEPGSMRTGPFGSDLRHSEFVSEGVAVLGIDNAVRNRFAWDERRFITYDKYEELRRYTVKPNDVIITIMGTTGRSAVVPDDIPLAITTKHLATITVNRDIAEPEFVSHSIYRHPEVLTQIANSHRGAIMPGLNLGLIQRLELPVPPPEVQQEFAQFVDAVRGLELLHHTKKLATEDMFNSLLQRAFRGEL